MPQLIKGGKWVFGWVVIDAQGTVTIPPQAAREYGFYAGDEVVFTPGSRASGGFGLSKENLLEATPIQLRIIEWGRIDAEKRVLVPSEIGALPGARLLVVRGSGRALGFLQRGRIYEEALNHSNIAVFA